MKWWVWMFRLNLLKIAKATFQRNQLVMGDMRFLPLKPKVFAGVSMDTSFGYLPSEADDRVTLSEVKRV